MKRHLKWKRLPERAKRYNRPRHNGRRLPPPKGEGVLHFLSTLIQGAGAYSYLLCYDN